MKLSDIITIDFETDPIKRRPEYPPKPVGVAIKHGSKSSRYLSFGHTEGNNCTREAVEAVLREALTASSDLLFHNARFDLDVLQTHFPDIAHLVDWSRVHDTHIMLFLEEPRAPSYSLKPSAERLLGEPPAERDAIIDWLLEHQPVEGVKLSRSSKSPHYAGAYVARAPVKIVGPYACGDVDRTFKIAKKLLPELKRRKMIDAYERERALLPVLLDMERTGMRVDVKRLRRDVKKYEAAQAATEAWVRRKLKIKDPDFNIDSNAQLAEALIRAGYADETSLGVTKTGKVQTNKAALASGVTNAQLLAVLKYRSQLATCLQTFMRPWLATAEKSGGVIYTQWHSIRHDRGGARTGRLASSPNFQNIANEFAPIFGSGRKGALPKDPIDLPPLPVVRDYVIPFEDGHKLGGRDFSSQELRMLAHFEDGALRQAFCDKPDLDLHEHVAKMISRRLNRDVSRKSAKVLNFATIYGMGRNHLAEVLAIDIVDARKLLAAYFGEFPSIQELMRALTARGKSGEAIRTWGGREYYPEEPKIINGRMRDFYYKLLNYLIQGSSADLTKECMIAFHRDKDKRTRVYASVHDEILFSAPTNIFDREMAKLKTIMNAQRLDVPMLSDGAAGVTWERMKDCD